MTQPVVSQPWNLTYACVVHLGFLVILCRIVLPAMSHDAVVDRAAGEKHLRDILSATSKPERPKSTRSGTKENRNFGVLMSQGRVVYDFAVMSIGGKPMSLMVQSEQTQRLPKGFWPACCRFCFHRVCTDAFRKSLSKALLLYLRSLIKGATTTCGMLVEKKTKDKRSDGGSLNSTECPELGQLLYEWFIDCLQIFNARVDGPLFLSRARYLKERVLDAGYQPQAMPSMSGEAGKSWFRRWRKRFRVVSRKTVKHLKVSWSKLRQRVRVYLKNVFALRFLWLRCFGELKK